MKSDKIKGSYSLFSKAGAAFILLCIIIVFMFLCTKRALMILRPELRGEVIWWVCAALFSLTFINIRMRELSPPTSTIFKFLFTLFGCYFAFPLTLLPDVSLLPLTELRLSYRHIIFPALCLAGFWRPSFGVISMMGAVVERLSLSIMFESTLTKTEFFSIVEFGVVLFLGVVVIKYIKCIPYLNNAEDKFSTRDSMSLPEKLVLCTVAIHFSSYFYSALQKSFQGEHFFSWILHNKTQYMMLASNTLGHLPLSFNCSLASLSYEYMTSLVIFINTMVLFGELMAIIAGLRLRWVIYLSVFFSIMHLVIFLTTGICFYKWVVLNMAIMFGFWPIRHKPVPRLLQYLFVLIVVLSPLKFIVYKLGWWDTRAFNHEQFFAITADGQEIEVPTNYWGSFSVQYAQSRRIRYKSDGFFPTETLGSVYYRQDIMEQANTFDFTLPAQDASDCVTKNFANPDNTVTKHVKLYHQYVLRHVDSNGHINYDFYPHHIWSMPWKFKPFHQLDKRTIKAYRYVVNSTYLDYKEGVFLKDIVRTKSHVIPVSSEV